MSDDMLDSLLTGYMEKDLVNFIMQDDDLKGEVIQNFKMMDLDGNSEKGTTRDTRGVGRKNYL